MKQFFMGGRELPQGQGYVCSIIQNNRLLFPLGRYHSDDIKKTIAYCLWHKAFLIIFCVLFSMVSVIPACGQGADGLSKIKPLQVGDMIPDEVWNMPLGIANHSNEVGTTTLSEYRDKRLIVIDFWATWCGSCVSSLKRVDSFIRQFADVELLAVTNEYRDKVLPFLKNNNWNFISVIEDTKLQSYFPHRAVPHVVWVADGKVMAITGPNELSKDYLSAYLENGVRINGNKTEDMNFDIRKPLLFNSNGGGFEQLLFQSLFTKKVQVSTSGAYPTKQGITLLNMDVVGLILEAYEDIIPDRNRRGRIVFEMDDSVKCKMIYPEEAVQKKMIKDGVYNEWMQSNVYCYSLVSPKSIDQKLRKKIMVNDLSNFLLTNFLVAIDISKVDKECLVLEIIDRQRYEDFVVRSMSSNQNKKRYKYVNSLYMALAIAHQNDHRPLVNRVMDDRPISFDINSDLKDISRLNKELNRLGMQVCKREVSIDVVRLRQVRKDVKV